MNETKTDCRLYLITPPAFDPAAFANTLAAALDGGDVAAVQLRLKDADDDTVRRAADALVPVCRDLGSLLLMNDRPDLARETGCDGVHVGQQDASYPEARKIMGANAVVGVTCHDSRHLAIEAADGGADYVAFGAFFPTTTKAAKAAADIEILEWWSDLMVVPSVAIGGITPENCPALVRAGTDFLAVVSAVWDHPEDPGAAVRAFNNAISNAS
ncbi:MAG: thiamine phosphate synthase [Alphaproteobacteria bacterium]|jgi:thiamine-phosphate pyrophosphorylase|nr:thiamine phosphate synthase [Alphaproteobacteria bacterium]MBT7943826.1 thiamine phosphate synthase [Alphaproteobacteria bacterium]